MGKSKHLQSAPDPDVTEKKVAEKLPTEKKEQKPQTENKNYITSCSGCGLHTAGKLKSCPTENCKGTITILEV